MIQGTIRRGRTKVDGFLIGEVSINRTAISGVSPLTAHYALANAASATMFGKTTKSAGWSTNTLQKMAEFIDAVENDIANDVFEDGTEAVINHGIPVGEGGVPEL